MMTATFWSYVQDCKNTEQSASVHAYVSKGINWAWFIPYLLVENSASASSIDNNAKSGDWSLDCYVEGSGIDRYKSDNFEGSFSKSHNSSRKLWFGSPGDNVRNEVDASVSHDQDSDVSTSSLSI